MARYLVASHGLVNKVQCEWPVTGRNCAFGNHTKDNVPRRLVYPFFLPVELPASTWYGSRAQVVPGPYKNRSTTYNNSAFSTAFLPTTTSVCVVFDVEGSITDQCLVCSLRSAHSTIERKKAPVKTYIVLTTRTSTKLESGDVGGGSHSPVYHPRVRANLVQAQAILGIQKQHALQQIKGVPRQS